MEVEKWMRADNLQDETGHFWFAKFPTPGLSYLINNITESSITNQYVQAS